MTPLPSFSSLMERVRAFQQRVFGVTWPRDLDALAQQYSMLITRECFEVLDETNFKPHKRPHPVNLDKVREETVDVFIYAMALAAAVFLSPEAFLAAVEEKVAVNEARLAREEQRI